MKFDIESLGIHYKFIGEEKEYRFKLHENFNSIKNNVGFALLNKDRLEFLEFDFNDGEFYLELVIKTDDKP